MKLTKKQQKELKELKEIIKDHKKFFSMDSDKRSKMWKRRAELQHIDNLKNVRFRLKNDDNKYYFANQLKKFENNIKKYGYENIKSKEIKRVDFYNTYFEIVNYKECVDREKGFYNKYELLGFIVGYNKGLEYEK
tara:strand:+ start:706 stop:1110 length:405 start_codon:yes stop_codon:yes gene_type:complete